MRLLWVVLCSTLVGSGARKPDYPTTAKVAKFNPPPPPNNPMLHIVDPKLARRQDEPNNVVRAGLQVCSLGAATNTASPHWCVPFHPSRLFLPIPGCCAACGVTPLDDRERRVGCSMDSSCELLRSIDPASGSVHCCEMPCRTVIRTSINTDEG
jgi:hypothetical protein